MAAQAEIAATAGDEILHINAVARRDVIDFCTHCFHPTRDLVPESHWQWISRRNACAIVRIGMADPARRHANQNFGRADLWKRDLGIFQRFPEPHEPHSSHPRLIRKSQCCPCQPMRVILACKRDKGQKSEVR